jgi:protein-glutamine gamma-glutamyltransferase
VLPSDTVFRFSTYLSLVLSCAVLGYAEWDYLPEASGFAALTAIALVVSFLLEGKFALTLKQANTVGGIILILAVLWFAFHWKRDHELLNTLPAGAMPFVGPLLMAAIAAKLFRPKHAGDWWAMYGVGLSGVILAGALAEDEIFVLLFLLYIPAAAWSLTLFFQRRAAGAIPPVPPPPPREAAGAGWDVATWFPWLAGTRDRSPTVAGPPPDSYPAARGSWLRRSHFFRTAGLVAAASLLALPAFFLTPRSQGLRWQLPRGQMETGFSPESSIDLGKTGTLHTSADAAFEVIAKNADGSPKEDITPNQRWRGTGYIEYEAGKWSRTINFRIFAGPSSVGLMEINRSGRGRLPNLGPDQFTLEYKLSDKIRGALLADPAAYLPGQPSPIVHEYTGGSTNWVQNWDTSFMPHLIGGSRVSRYTQVNRPLPDPDAGMPFTKSTVSSDDVFNRLRRPEAGELTRWSRRLLDTLARDGKIPADVEARRDPVTRLPAEADYRTIGNAFRDYLSNGGGYSYSLELKRKDKSIDPIEDFLFNTKSGHCERYATALVLMLRGVGIPSQFVLGFKGSDYAGDGKYIIRQEDAHAWAEILVPYGPPVERQWQWVVMDPTPGTASSTEDPGLWASARESGRRLFQQYIVGLNTESQKQVVSEVRSAVEGNALAVGAVALALAGFLALLLTTRRKGTKNIAASIETPRSAVPYFDAMIEKLKRLGLTADPAQTPAALARSAEAWLKERLPAAVEVPGQIAAAVERARYAGETLNDSEIQALNAALTRLDAPPEPRP